ncbi:4'-phosphopantetheinyl transferase family protein [Oceaniglobus trochenteri]|uniref:4'-phosphopantetheinyl transferase family protein n=1 Tax=Oceaniglobus trochenteri TaxID=2763260 RepID=UPI001CFFDFC5|nr:4'-phosphopantetheinyl transferase superfamily protein [Oceaniglobus trochenteri]
MTATVDLWRWRLDDPDPRSLSPDERARAARFVHDRDRDRFVAGRARLRAILAGYLGCAPGDIAFGYGAHGRPRVAGVHFNLSHTGDLAQLAVSRDLVPGVDIETVAPIDMAVARAHFSANEVQALCALPEGARLAAFYRCWTRKEAFLKALGTGLSTDLHSFAVTLAPGEPPAVLSCAGGDAGAWRLFDLAPAPGVAGALALRCGGRDVRLAHHG